MLHTFAVARFHMLDEMMTLTCVKFDGELIFDMHEKTWSLWFSCLRKGHYLREIDHELNWVFLQDEQPIGGQHKVSPLPDARLLPNGASEHDLLTFQKDLLYFFNVLET